MTKKIPEDLKKVVREAMKEYRYQLFMQHWDVKIAYMKEDKIKESDMNVAMSMNTNRRYLVATLEVYPFVVKGWIEKHDTKEDIKRMVAHECAHLVTQHFMDVATAIYKDSGETHDAWETCTEIVGRLAYQLARKKK